jgi:hypothetical protein
MGNSVRTSVQLLVAQGLVSTDYGDCIGRPLNLGLYEGMDTGRKRNWNFGSVPFQENVPTLFRRE